MNNNTDEETKVEDAEEKKEDEGAEGIATE